MNLDKFTRCIIYSKRLKASMLPTVLLISILIALISMALIGVAYYQRLLRTRDRTAHELRRNAYSALGYLLASKQLTTTQPLIFDLYGEGKDSVEILKKHWGFFDMGIVQTFRGSHHQFITALLGNQPDSIAKSALYLPDENRPLAIAGNTHLKGRLYVPQGTVRSAFVDSRGFTGTAPVVDQLRKSRTTLPLLSDEFTHRLHHYQTKSGLPIQTLPAVLHQSFLAETLTYTSSESMVITGQISGNIILHGDQTLIISRQAQLRDIIVVARKIIVQTGFVGNLQVLARDTLQVESGCRFNYPSILCTGGRDTKCYLSIGEGSMIDGLVIASSDIPNVLENIVEFGQNTLITGQVYVKGMVQAKGNIHGNMVSQRLFLSTPSAFYENHLFDAQIDVNKRPKAFLTSPILSNAPTRILQWLD